MAVKYKTLITTAGAAKLAAATAGGARVVLAQMAVGDGGGALPVPDVSQSALIGEQWRAALNKISVDAAHKNYVVAELLIPPEVGGFWLREMGLYDTEGTLIAVANMAESYKPELAEGSGRAQTVRMVIIISELASVDLTIDTTTVMATQDYVDDKLAEHEESRKHPDATLREKGFVQLSSATDSESEVLAATPKAVKSACDKADAADKNAGTRLAKASNLEDIESKEKARKNLGLGTAATLDVQTSKDDIAAGRVLVNGSTFSIDAEKVAIDKALQTPQIELRGGAAAIDFNSFGDGKDYNVSLHNDTDNSLSFMGYAVNPLFKNLNGQFIGKGSGTGWGSDFGVTDVAPFNATRVYAPQGDQWCPLIKGEGYKGSQYVSSVSYGFLIPAENEFNRPVIQSKNDNDTLAYWMFYNTGGQPSPVPDGRIRFVGTAVRDVAFLDEVYSPSRPPPQQDLSQYATTQWTAQNFSTFDWVSRNFVTGMQMGAQAMSAFANNSGGSLYLPGSCVCTGYTSPGSSNANDIRLYYKPLQMIVAGVAVNIPG